MVRAETTGREGRGAGGEGAVIARAPAGARARVGTRPWATAEGRVILAILLVAAVRQLVLVFTYPPFQGHDEVAHFGYLWNLDRLRRLPTLYDDLPAFLAPYSRFTLDWPALYTANHPPGYYLLAWPVYLLAGPDPIVALHALRFLAIPPFLLTIWLGGRLARALFPGDLFLAVTVPAWLAFQPNLAFEGAILNNDSLAICCGALLLYLCVAALRTGLPAQRALALGIVLGLGLLVKATVTAFLPLVIVMALWCRWPRPWGIARRGGWWRDLGATAAALLVPTILLPAPWYAFLRRTYGDFSAFDALDELQADWSPPAASFTDLLLSPRFHLERLHEYWGFFGWKLVPLSHPQLRVVQAVIALSAAGLLVAAGRVILAHMAPRDSGKSPLFWRLDAPQMMGLGLLVAANGIAYAAMIYFGTVNWLTQARYLFPVAPASALLMLLGLRALVPERLTRPAAALTIAALATFGLVVLLDRVLPYSLGRR